MKIGLLYVQGALPAFENFGGLPTHLVKEYGLVNGKPAHRVLDALIIPGGSIIESDSVNSSLSREIKKMARDGALILGMCSGFQVYLMDFRPYTILRNIFWQKWQWVWGLRSQLILAFIFIRPFIFTCCFAYTLLSISLAGWQACSIVYICLQYNF